MISILVQNMVLQVLTEFDTTALKLVITQEELENEDYEIPDL